MANVKFIKDILYTLKKDYGTRIIYAIIDKSEIDPKTGLVNIRKRSYTIKQAIQVSTKLQRTFVQDIAYLAANKNFTYGALFDTDTSVWIIDRRDLPRDIIIEMGGFFFKNHERFYIKSAEILEHNCGWIVTAQTHKGALPFEPIEAKIVSTLQFQQEVVNA